MEPGVQQGYSGPSSSEFVATVAASATNLQDEPSAAIEDDANLSLLLNQAEQAPLHCVMLCSFCSWPVHPSSPE